MFTVTTIEVAKTKLFRKLFIALGEDNNFSTARVENSPSFIKVWRIKLKLG
jgi:hypothetical protein